MSALLYTIDKCCKCPPINMPLQLVCIVSVLFPIEAAFLCFIFEVTTG